MVEYSIEGKHALGKANLRASSHPAPASVSLAMRLTEWRRRFAQTPSLMLDVVGSTSLLTSAHGGAKLAIVQQLGLQSHPTVVDLQAR
eukprot:14093344-Alexandrium_andersonii.AAC.1